MFISEFLNDTNFGFASFTLLVYWRINYSDTIDRFTVGEGDRSNCFENVLWYDSASIITSYQLA